MWNKNHLSAEQNDGSKPSPSPSSFPVQKVRLPEEISNQIFPVTEGWLMVGVVKIIFSSVLFAVLLFFLVLVEVPYLLTSESPVFVILLLISASSLFALVKVYSVSCWRNSFEYKFTETGITYGKSDAQTEIPYGAIVSVESKQKVSDFLFGYAILRIYYSSPELLVFGKENAYKISINGLRREDAEHIEHIYYQYILPQLPKNNNHFSQS